MSLYGDDVCWNFEIALSRFLCSIQDCVVWKVFDSCYMFFFNEDIDDFMDDDIFSAFCEVGSDV